MADRWMDERDREWRERDWRRSESYGRIAGDLRRRSAGVGYDGDQETWDERREAAGDFLQRAGERIDSWFRGGEEHDDARRAGGGHRGRGPKGYQRSDARINEDVHERLTDDPWLDASDMEVAVKSGEVTLSGRVESREAKRRAERLVEDLSGVRHVQNNLRIDPDAGFTGAGRGFGSSAVEAEMRRNELEGSSGAIGPATGSRRS